MKAIINGLRYDTNNAEKLAEVKYENGDWSFSAALYVTENDNWFIAGAGSRFSMFQGEEKIIAFPTNIDALRWAEQFLRYEEIEKIFKDLIKDA